MGVGPPLAFGALAAGLTLAGVLAVVLAVAAWASVFRNPALSGGAKAMWFFAILLFPIFGALVYFGVRESW
jgi:Phospholipase_D-nuclease N-terminal